MIVAAWVAIFVVGYFCLVALTAYMLGRLNAGELGAFAVLGPLALPIILFVILIGFFLDLGEKHS